MPPDDAPSPAATVNEPVGIGILSTANIARGAVGPAVAASRNARLVAVGSRDEGRARAFAEALEIERAHGSYEALLADPEVEAVYVALPNALHEAWTPRALEAGKHVLCEKPLAPTAAACERMGRAAAEAERVLMEAFMYRFHPRVRAAERVVHDGEIGRPAFLDATFTFHVRDRGNIRFSRELAGGALLDVGCYTVDVARRLVGEAPVAVSAFARFDDEVGVDLETAGLLHFTSGAIATVRSALTLPRREAVEVHGSEGGLAMERAFLPGNDATTLRVSDADGGEDPREIAGRDPYGAMVDVFAQRVRGHAVPDAPASDAAEAARSVAVLEALAASAREGGRVVTVDA